MKHLIELWSHKLLLFTATDKLFVPISVLQYLNSIFIRSVKTWAQSRVNVWSLKMSTLCREVHLDLKCRPQRKDVRIPSVLTEWMRSRKRHFLSMHTCEQHLRAIFITRYINHAHRYCSSTCALYIKDVYQVTDAITWYNSVSANK